MSELDEIAASFGVSKPIFVARMSSDNRTIQFDLKERYTPPASDDPVTTLMAEYYSEFLNVDKRCITASTSPDRVFSEIKGYIKQFVVRTSPLKNPKQAKLFKWLNDGSFVYNDASSVGFIALYRYIMNNGIMHTKEKNNPHVKNVVAILELMREKHGR